MFNGTKTVQSVQNNKTINYFFTKFSVTYLWFTLAAFNVHSLILDIIKRCIYSIMSKNPPKISDHMSETIPALMRLWWNLLLALFWDQVSLKKL